LNPGNSTLIEYVPTDNDGKTYKPVAVVVSAYVTPVASLIAVTDAPGTTAPEESVTVPSILEVPVWANAAAVMNNNSAAVIESHLMLLDIIASLLPAQKLLGTIRGKEQDAQPSESLLLRGYNLWPGRTKTRTSLIKP
jgi:hypothetical protein